MLRTSPTARWRSIGKAVTWRFFGSLVTFALGFTIVFLLGNRQHPEHAAKVGGALAIGETVVKILLFYIHERVWDRIPFGRADTQPLAAEPEEAVY